MTDALYLQSEWLLPWSLTWLTPTLDIVTLKYSSTFVFLFSFFSYSFFIIFLVLFCFLPLSEGILQDFVLPFISFLYIFFLTILLLSPLQFHLIPCIPKLISFLNAILMIFLMAYDILLWCYTGILNPE